MFAAVECDRTPEILYARGNPDVRVVVTWLLR